MGINKRTIPVNLFITLLIFCTLSVGSCKKKGDGTEGPVISLFNISGNTFLSSDTIPYSVVVEGSENIQSVSVFICGPDYQPVTPAQITEVNGLNKSFSDYYTYSNRYLDAGSYYFVCSAVDANNITKRNISIQIIPLARQVEGFMILASDNGNYRIGSLYPSFDSVAFHLTLTSVPADAIINSYSRQLNILFENGTLKSYDYPGFQEAWTKSNLSHPSSSYKSEIQVISNLTACGTAYGNIVFFDEIGMQRKSVLTSASDQTVCRKFIQEGDKIISYNTGYLNGITQIAVSSLTGGGVISEYPLSIQVTDLTSYQFPDIFIWSAGELFTFNTVSPLIYKISDFPESPLYKAIRISENSYLLSAGNSVYSYNPVYNAYFIQPVNDGELLFYEPYSSTTFAVKQNKVSVYTANQLVSEKLFPFETLKIFPVYNK
jgi:hypothetical protein